MVEIINDGGCYSYVGRRGRKQPISLAFNGCYSARIIIHEFIHAIGFDHEQSRPDRDKYVRINLSNIPRRVQNQFVIAKGSNTYGVPYDFKSIMHYRWNAFASNKRQPSIVSLVSVSSCKSKESGNTCSYNLISHLSFARGRRHL